MKLKKQEAFTLIELLVVIAIISILASILFVAIDPKSQTDKALDAKRAQVFNELDKALNLYYLDKGYYPKMAAHNWHDGYNYVEFKNELTNYMDMDIIKIFGYYWDNPGDVEFLYKSNAVDNYSTYGIAFMYSDIANKNASKDGGYYTGWWEKGNLVQYCMDHYSGTDRNWWFTNNHLCAGGD